MAPSQYSPLSIPQGLMQQNPNYGDAFLQSYDQQLKTSYQEAVNRRQEAQVKRDEIEQDRQLKQDAAEQEIANRVMQSGASDYEGISSIEEDVYKEFGMSENLLKKYKERMQIEAATAKAAKDNFEKIGSGYYDISDPSNPKPIIAPKEKGGSAKAPVTLYDADGNPRAVEGGLSAAQLQSYYDQGLSKKNPKSDSLVEGLLSQMNGGQQAVAGVDKQVGDYKAGKAQAQKELAELQRLKQERLKNGK